MNYRRYLVVFLSALTFISLILTGCDRKETSSSSSESTVTATAPPLLDIDVTQLVTVEQVNAALGVSVGEAQVYESGTIAHYASDDVLSSAEISIMKCSRDVYDVTVTMYEDATDTPNLGEVAKWSVEAKQLLVYSKGYMIGIVADVAEKSNEDVLVSARQLAALIIEKL